MTKQRQGFLLFGVSDEDIILQDSLTQVAGVEVSYSSDQGGGQLIDSDGFDANGAKGRVFDLGANVANNRRLFDSGNMSFEVDTDYLDSAVTVAADGYPISRTQGWVFKDTTGYFQLVFINSFSTGRFLISPTGKAGKTRIEIVWRRGLVDIYIDDLLFSKGVIGNHAGGRANFDIFYVGALTASTNIGGYKTKNYQLSFRPQLFPLSVNYGSIGFVGDSFVNQGAFPKWSNTVAGETWPIDPGYGFDSSDVALTTGGSFRDVGMLPTFIRQLSKNNIWTINNKNYARSGARVSSGDIPAKQTEMFADSNYRPDVIFSCAGTNDAASTAVVVADFETQYKAMLTEANGHGVKHYVLGTIPSLRADTTYQNAAHDAHLAELNATIKALLAWSVAQGHSMEVHLSDDFNNFGGHNIDLNDFQDNNIHLSEQGSYKKGKWMADALINS